MSRVPMFVVRRAVVLALLAGGVFAEPAARAGIAAALDLAPPPRVLIPQTPAPPKPVWWGPNGGINNGNTETVCYNFDDGVFPNPTPSMVTTPAGLPGPVFSTQLVSGVGTFEIVSPPPTNPLADNTGKLRVPLPAETLPNGQPPPSNNASFVSVSVSDTQLPPPDYKEIYLSVDLYVRRAPTVAGPMAPPPVLLSIDILNVIPTAPPPMVQIVSAGIDPLPIPAGNDYIDAVHIAAFFRVCPCPPSFFFGIFQPNGGFDIDNMCLGGQCFSGSIPKLNPIVGGRIDFEIPAPGAACVLACSGLLAMRRRR